ncbi:MAG: hypothetical protein GX929_05410 [Clostridiales bacterium]|jgi:hypothetical protein|nr:hypothetical protein [Clostridiales bacterium]
MCTCVTPNDPRFLAGSDARSIQNAVCAAAKGDIRTVRIPRYNARTGKPGWLIDRTILLPSEITVLLDDCRLTLAPGVYENIFRNENLYTDVSLTQAGEQHGIRIIGRGMATLDGGEGNDLREANSGRDGRPHIRFNNLILLHNVRDYVLEGFRCENMRWWAINQIFCRNGRLSHLNFYNGDIIPNQDGINLRIGCSEILIEDITGRTGDDVVALTALPLGSDRALSVEGRDSDIHDVTIRDVRAHTRQTVVALRNCDGAKLYRIRIENIADVGGPYGPWGVVRIGENNYYRQRPSLPGETYQISVRGVYSRCRGTVFLAGNLSDSDIRDIYADGTSMYGVSTFSPEFVSKETGCKVSGGVTMENVVIENIHYNAIPGHLDSPTFAFPGVVYNGCAVDFRCMRETDTLKNVVFRDLFAKAGVPLWLAREGLTLDVRA